MASGELKAYIRAAKSGRPEGFQSILSDYGHRLYGYFYRSTGDRHDAEDLVGEMMLRLVRNIENYDEQGRFEPWLFRMAANLVRDRIRRRQASPVRTSLTAEGEDHADWTELVSAPESPVDGPMLAQEVSEQLMTALESLDETTRQMILLRHFSEMSFAEIADLLKCPIGTVLAKVHRGLKTLRGRLERRGEWAEG